MIKAEIEAAKERVITVCAMMFFYRHHLANRTVLGIRRLTLRILYGTLQEYLVLASIVAMLDSQNPLGLREVIANRNVCFTSESICAVWCPIILAGFGVRSCDRIVNCQHIENVLGV
jgi:hypothetical protein